jgi:hypothetical protein
MKLREMGANRESGPSMAKALSCSVESSGSKCTWHESDKEMETLRKTLSGLQQVSGDDSVAPVEPTSPQEPFKNESPIELK